MLSNIIAKLRQEGALSTNVYHENNSRQHGMCLGEHYITGLKTETNKQKQKKKSTQLKRKNKKFCQHYKKGFSEQIQGHKDGYFI